MNFFPDINKTLAFRLCQMIMDKKLKNPDVAVQAYLDYKEVHKQHNPKLFEYMEKEHESHFMETKIGVKTGRE